MATNDDTMMEQLAAAQNATGEAIQGIIRNFKKDSAPRKTSQYYEERIRRLDAAWAEFEIIDNKIRCLEAPPLNHKYFTEDYYTKISDLTNNYRELFEKAMMEIPKESASNIGQQITNDDPKAPSRPGPTNTTTTPANSRIRRQNVMMASLQRLFTTDPEATNLQQKKKLWAQIEELHFSIWESSTDPPKEGYDMKTYLNLEQLIAGNLRAISQDSEKGGNYTQPNVLPLPKITLPTFCGDYLKWRGFSDLFSQLVDSQQLPTAQKMWYLKSNLGGEAEKVISHLSATADNYSAAWNLLQARYNNQRIIVSTIMQQLLDQPNTGSSAAAIKLLHDTTQECIHALNNIGIDTTSWDPMLLHLLIKKLDRGTLILYERTISNPKELQNLQDFLKFLETHFQSLEATTQKEKSPRVCVAATSANKSESPCPLCKTGHHPLHQCQKFQQLSPQGRLSFVQNQNQCVNCLKSGHTAKVCRSRPCKICKKLHHSLLHLNNKQSTNQGSSNRGTSQMTTSTTTTASATTKPNVHEAPTITHEVSSLTAASGHTFNSYVLLSTAVVRIKTETQEVECRALLDAGSQVNFITERLANRLNIAKQPSSTNIKGIGNCNTKTRHRVNVSLHSRINGFSTRLEALVLPQIVAPQPSQFVNIDDWPLPKNLTLADPAFNKPDRIDILLGAEHCLQLLAVGQIKLSPHLPTLQNTVLGWIVGGKLDEKHSTEAICGICTEDEGLEASIARLWELDEVKPTTRPLSIADKQCEEHFAQHTTRNNQNHFVVRIPFHQNPNLLGDSHGIALNRFFALERRLQRSPELKAKYIEFMDEYESMGHMTKWEPKSCISPTYYIPHHCVLRPESSTTKLRVVFDASAKTSSGYSLNDLMFTGPTLQSELFSILLRFRMPRFVFTADVAKMYRQILVAPEDRQLQLIIWRKDTTRPITYYQLNTVTYGTRSAPYLATKCLTQLAKENETRYPLASKFLQENFYVDDGLGGFDSLITALDVQQQLVQILKEGGFTLRKWCANHPKLLHNIPQGHVEVDLDFESTKVDSIKTLGLIWLPKDDKLGIRVNIESIKKITKRTATSDLARVFDPLGLLSPVTVTAKIFIQELWALKLDWDQSLPEHMHTKWMNFRTDLNELKTLQLSRHIFNGGMPTSVQLHIFTDASEKAYGAAAYLRSTTTNGSIITRLLCAKSRVAPLKTQTIPRLELCAAALGAQLAAKITTDLQLSSQVWFWTDSEIVLAWINSPAALNTFVANRVSTILQTTQASQWRHVSSKINPADILSRGISPRHLKDCSLWFFGPLFLHGQDAAWPPKYNPALAIPTDLERKVKQTLTATSTEPDFIYKINHGNSFWRLQNIVGYVLRFITQIKGKGELRPSQKSLTTTELDNALKLIIKQIQASDFKQEIHQLAKYKELRGTSNLSNLSPFLDTDGLIRVGGRLEASPLPYDSKHQFLIPYNDPIAKLIFEMVHKDNKHCGPQTLLGIIRQKFWPIKGKIMSRATVHRCTICSRAKPALFHQIMGNLPSTRVTPARAFINAGVDYCGPITVHYKLRGKRPHKAYIAVFCCFATKAVHLELVSDLTTEAFIGALKRFISRRGHCQNLYCDNATNFVGAKNKLPELSTVIHSSDAQATILNACSKKGIQFNFIPPRAPHFGGLWEAAVKSAKYLLVRTLGNASLTYEELETVIVEIEAILNSRPISPMSNDANDIGALTPGHFLIGEPLTAQIDAQAKPPTLKLETRWKLVSHLKHEFWKRWSRDYLNELQYRHKWREQSKNLKPGATVLIKEDNIPVMKWPLGRVIKTYKGQDGVIRVADVQTSSGILKRAIQYLAPLPKLNEEAEEEELLPPPQTSEATDPHELLSEPQSSKASADERPPTKKQRTLASSILTTLLTVLLLLPLVSTDKVKIIQFEPNLGLYFEGISNTKVSRSEWNIISYYNLNPYWKEISRLMIEATELHRLCEHLTQNRTCPSLLQAIDFSIAGLKDKNLLLKRRLKRGAINVIGNVANSLFGVLDSNYAEQMSNTINALNENETQLKHLLMNQTSIVDATLNILKHDEESVKQRFDSMNNQLIEITSKLHENDRENYQANLFKILMLRSIQLSLTSARLHRIQSEIISSLTDSHHGKISPMLLSPSQLQTELVQVKNYLPTSLELPVGGDNILQLYKIMSVKGGITKDHVIFHISIPLADPEPFELLKPHPIPVSINGTMLAIRPCSDFFAINAHRDQYFILSERQWTTCSIIKENEHLCQHLQSRFNANAGKCLCELSLLKYNTRKDCNIGPIADNTSLIQLEHSNQWLYTMPRPSRISSVCGQERSQLTIKGSGFLKLSPDCTLKLDSITIQGHQTVSTSLQTSYTAISNISEIIYPEEVQDKIIHFKTYGDQIKNISELQGKLHKMVSSEFPSQIKTIQYHHGIIAYVALGLTIMICITMAWKRIHCKRSEPNHQPPTPASRQHISTAEFEVSVT